MEFIFCCCKSFFLYLFGGLNKIVYRESVASFQLIVPPDKENLINCGSISAEFKSSFSETHILMRMACAKGFARADMNLEDYYENTNQIFKENIDIEVYILDFKSINLYLIKMEKTIVNVEPDKAVQLTTIQNGLTLIVTISFRCEGYHGSNCRLRKIDHPNIYVEPITLRTICKSKDSHDSGDILCKNQKNKCNDHGLCYENFYNKKQYCVCHDGYYGYNCEGTVSSNLFDEDNILFASEMNLPKVPETIDCKDACLSCKKYREIEVCLEIGLKKINDCGDDCDETCGDVYCRMENEKGIFYYVRKYSENPKYESKPN